MKKKIFITGGEGMLATAVEEFYSKNDCELIAPTHKELDILKTSDLEEALTNFRPDIVFHTAALHVEDCETNQKLAFATNVEASANLAKICQRIKSILVYISSCGLFGDEIKYYKEVDPVVLKTVYARTKYEGETLALKECENTYAIRPGWLFGGSTKHKKDFVYQRYREAKQMDTIKSANDKFGCPTYVDDLVVKIDEIIKTNNPGIYHVTNKGGCSKAEYIGKIVKSCKLKTKVEQVDSSNFPRKANVPNCELLENSNIKSINIKPLPSWQEAIERYVNVMLKEK